MQFYPYHSIPWFHAWNIGRLKIFWDSAFQELQFTMGWSHWAFKAAHLTVSWRDSTGFGLLKNQETDVEVVPAPAFQQWHLRSVLLLGNRCGAQEIPNLNWGYLRQIWGDYPPNSLTRSELICQIRSATTWAKQRSSFLSCVTSLRLLNTSAACGYP